MKQHEADGLIDLVGEGYTRWHDPSTVVFPADTEQVSEVLKLCSRNGWTVSPRGGGTKRWTRYFQPDVLLHTNRLKGVVEHSWQDLTATVRAGTPWAEMERSLAEHGQHVALDPAGADLGTVGGTLATNDSGLLRLKYGSLRDLVLGMTIVLADGTIARTGGKVVKNVAGYDLPKLLTGSFGTLGVITEATFRLHPRPRDTASFTVRSSDIVPLADLMTALLKAGMLIERMQLRNEPLAFALDVQFAASAEVLAQHAEQLGDMGRGLAVAPAKEDVFRLREQLCDSGWTVLKITCLPTKLAAVVAGMAQLAQMPGYGAECIADPVGIVTAVISCDEGDDASIVADLRQRLIATGGAVVALKDHSWKEPVDRWGPPPASIDVMRAIKQEFDPQRLLNPGVFVGGI